MTEPQYLTTREFDGWRVEHDKKMDRLVELMELQNTTNLETAVRVRALEVNQENAGKLSAKLSTVVAAAVSAAIGGMFALLGGR